VIPAVKPTAEPLLAMDPTRELCPTLIKHLIEGTKYKVRCSAEFYVRRDHSNSSHFRELQNRLTIIVCSIHSKMFALFATRLWKKSMRKSETVLMELLGIVSE